MNGKKQFRNSLFSTLSHAVTAPLAIAVVFALTVVLSQSAQAQTPTAAVVWPEKVLFSFNGTDGSAPNAGLIFDAAGNLYGTTLAGGAYAGTAFELTPTAGGAWTEQVLHNFGNGTDGVSPYAGLTLDAAGNLYGTTEYGGIYCAPYGCGTVFELTPAAGGGWTETVLHSFNPGNGTDGYLVYAGLIFDAAGNLYGTTWLGGVYGGGVVFELTPTAGGGWTEQVLYSFCPAYPNCADGEGPFANLIFDAAGNLYGTTYYGGTYGAGTVFELTPTVGGGWTETVLWSFGSGTDGYEPIAGLIFDAAGNLYGTTTEGGAYSSSCSGYGCGAVFELTPSTGGDWTEQVLHSFGNGTDGSVPYGGLVIDAAGNLYGTTRLGGPYNFGTVFELTPTGGGGWTESVQHSFNLNGTDGTYPKDGLIFDAAGNLYGTTVGGGTHGDGWGTVFELTPVYPCAKCSHAVRQ